MHHYYCTAARYRPLFLWYYTNDQIAALKAENIANHTGELSEYIEARISETKPSTAFYEALNNKKEMDSICEVCIKQNNNVYEAKELAVQVKLLNQH